MVLSAFASRETQRCAWATHVHTPIAHESRYKGCCKALNITQRLQVTVRPATPKRPLLGRPHIEEVLPAIAPEVVSTSANDARFLGHESSIRRERGQQLIIQVRL